jgi:hypothetical protein
MRFNRMPSEISSKIYSLAFFHVNDNGLFLFNISCKAHFYFYWGNNRRINFVYYRIHMLEIWRLFLSWYDTYCVVSNFTHDRHMQSNVWNMFRFDRRRLWKYRWDVRFFNDISILLMNKKPLESFIQYNKYNYYLIISQKFITLCILIDQLFIFYELNSIFYQMHRFCIIFYQMHHFSIIF